MKNKKIVPVAIAAVVLFWILLIWGLSSLGGSSKSTKNKSSENQSKNSAQTQTTEPKEQPVKTEVKKFEFIKTKTESDEPHSKIDLYYVSGDFDLESLKSLCRENKQKYSSGTFYALVVFDSKNNAEFPQDPVTAQYGLEEGKIKHIKAFYLFNSKNGSSELDYYDSNMWEGVAKTEKI